MKLCIVFALATLSISASGYGGDEDAPSGPPYKVTCKDTAIPGLSEWLPPYRSARICYPQAKGLFPLHIFAHGDFGGGPFFQIGYKAFHEELASLGFVVPAYYSCWADIECSGGQASFLEALKTLSFMERHPTLAPVDWSLPYSASGHSTGARAVLMMAALRDNPGYLSGTPFASAITADMRKSLKRLKAVAADHPDPMYLESFNPDVDRYDITETPVFVITGSADTWIEPPNSGWIDFFNISTPNKVFINVEGAGHIEPNIYHHEGPFIADFCKYFALGDENAKARIYGDGKDSLQRVLKLAPASDANSGDGKVSFLGCLQGSDAVPTDFSRYCSSKPSQDVGTKVAEPKTTIVFE